MADHLVKLIHANDLSAWDRFPIYEDFSGKTLADLRAEGAAREAVGTLMYALQLLQEADTPVVCNTWTVHTPWPISWPGRRSTQICFALDPGTTLEADIGRIKGTQLIAPLFMRSRPVQVRMLAPPRVHSSSKLDWAEKELECAPKHALDAARQYLAEPEPLPVLFVSHRWEKKLHPDPDGRQLEKLKSLSNCYIIYDYTSFPQDTRSPQGQQALAAVLDAMDGFIEKVVVLSAADYLTRGWCLYEYLTGALTHQIVCDEVRDPALIRLRNLVATDPNPPGSGLSSTYREAVNGRQHLILEAVNAILPAFAAARFGVEADRAIVRRLLVKRLLRTLPNRQEYIPYVGEWRTVAWTENEVNTAFDQPLQPEPFQIDDQISIFEPLVPSTLAEAVASGFAIQKQPREFERNPLDLTSFLLKLEFFKVVGKGIAVVAVAWIFFRVLQWVFK